MNLKWNSSVSAKAGYFCHKRHIRQLENSDIKKDGEERGRRRQCFSGACALRVGGRWFHLRAGVQGKFSASPNWRTLNETPYKFNEPPHFPTSNCSVSCKAAWWPLLPSCQYLRVSCSLPHLFPFSTFLIFIDIFLYSWELFWNIMKLRWFFFPIPEKFSCFLLSWKKNPVTFLLKAIFSVNIFLYIVDCSLPTVLDDISSFRGLKAL